mgnify:CR=1 FL=1
MSQNPLAAKIASPYARALYDFSVEQNLMHQITADFQNLEVFLAETPDLTNYLNNPLIDAQTPAPKARYSSTIGAHRYRQCIANIFHEQVNRV